MPSNAVEFYDQERNFYGLERTGFPFVKDYLAATIIFDFDWSVIVVLDWAHIRGRSVRVIRLRCMGKAVE